MNRKNKKLNYLVCAVCALVFGLSACQAPADLNPQVSPADVKAMANVTNFEATCISSGTVKLTWTNPDDADFAKVVITYGTSGSVTVLKTANPNNEATITGLTNGTEYEFTVKAYDEGGNASSGVSVNIIAGNGGLQGTPTGGQTQGAVIKETWMAANGNLKINETEIAKTSEVIAVPTGTVAKINMTSGDEKGELFTSSRKVKLSPFVMSQYEVTQRLYREVMGDNPSHFKDNPYGSETQENRPVENVTWFQACAFCNELTKKTFGQATDQCVYYRDVECTVPYTISNAYSNAAVYAAYDISTKKWTKTGYRLPTEAEWEFAARGGDPNALDSENKSIWSYAYAGVEIGACSWFDSNSSSRTHEVGKKEKNRLNLYDMSGNVWEWCYDKYHVTAYSNDSAYIVNGYVQNPVGASSSGNRCCRGGSYNNSADYCSVSRRDCSTPDRNYIYLGFRVCRSTEVESN